MEGWKGMGKTDEGKNISKKKTKKDREKGGERLTDR